MQFPSKASRARELLFPHWHVGLRSCSKPRGAHSSQAHSLFAFLLCCVHVVVPGIATPVRHPLASSDGDVPSTAQASCPRVGAWMGTRTPLAQGKPPFALRHSLSTATQHAILHAEPQATYRTGVPTSCVLDHGSMRVIPPLARALRRLADFWALSPNVSQPSLTL